MSIQFWQRWLIIVTVGVILYSLGLIFLPQFMHDLFKTLFFSTPANQYVVDSEATKFTIFTYGVLGAVIIGWMVSILSILLGPFRQGECSAWNTVTLSLLVWYVLDSGFSLYINNLAHAIFNTAFLIAFAIPLLATYIQFRHDYA